MSGSWLLVVAALAVPVSHRGDDVDNYDHERARMGRASARALVQRICGDHSYEDDAREILVERGLPTLPALFREQVRLEREDSNCGAAGREVGRWDKLGARVEIAPDGARMLIADVVSAAVVDTAGGRPLWSRRDLVYAAYARLSPDGEAVASLSTKEGLCLHRAADGVRVWCNGTPGAQSGYEQRLLAFSPDGQAIIAPGGRRQDWKLFLWEAKSGKPIGPLGPRIESLPSVVGASGSWVLLGDPLLQTVPLPKAVNKDYLAPLAVSADRRLLAGTDVEGRALHLVTLADGKPLNRVDLSPMGDLARAAAFSPDGTRLFVGTERGMILVFAASL